MDKKILTFGDIEIEKKNKKQNKTKKQNKQTKNTTNAIRLLGEKNYKYFIDYLYNNDKAIKLMLPKTSTYVKRYDGQTIWMYFLIEDDGLLKNITLFRIK